MKTNPRKNTKAFIYTCFYVSMHVCVYVRVYTLNNPTYNIQKKDTLNYGTNVKIQ